MPCIQMDQNGSCAGCNKCQSNGTAEASGRCLAGVKQGADFNLDRSPRKLDAGSDVNTKH